MTITIHQVLQGSDDRVSVSMLLRKTPKNRNGIQASYHRGRHGENTKARTSEGLAAWFLGFADACEELRGAP